MIVSSFDGEPPGEIQSGLGFSRFGQALDRFDMIPADSTQILLHLFDPIPDHTPSQGHRESQERGNANPDAGMRGPLHVRGEPRRGNSLEKVVFIAQNLRGLTQELG